MNDMNKNPGGLVGPIHPIASEVDLVGGTGVRSIAPLPAAPPAGAPSAASPMSLLRALRRRLALALGLGLFVSSVCSTAAWFLLPLPKYTATARYHVQTQTPQIAFKTADGAIENGDSFRRYQKTQVQMIKSRSVTLAATQQPEIRKLKILKDQKDPADWVLNNLVVQFPQESEVLEISLSADEPEAVAAIVNAVGQAYIDLVVGQERKLRVGRHTRLKELSSTYAAMMKEGQKAIRELATSAGSADRQTLALRQQYQMELRMTAQKELAGVQSQKRKLITLINAQRPEDLQETAAPSVTPGELEAQIEQHPDVAGLRDQLSRMQQQLESEAAHTGRVSRKAGMDPALKALRDEVDGLKRQLRKKREAVRPLVLRQLQEPQPAGTGRKSLNPQQELSMLEDLEKRLEDDITRLSKFDATLNTNTLDLQQQQDELRQMEEASQKINREVEVLNVELKAPDRVRRIDEAEVPRTREYKKWYMMFGMAALGSFLLPLLGIALLELRACKIDTVDEVVVGLGLPLVGSLPMLPARARHGGAAITSEKDRYWYNLLLESIDATRTMLMHAARGGSYRVVMITSALPGEGKTSLASHLATSLARSGQRTLLIDADLRRPSIHQLFDLTNEPGMSELLRAQVSLEDAIASTAIEELKVITAGQCDYQTLRILSQGGMGSHFAAFKEEFDFIIVDTSPVLPVADALIIAQQADAVLFSVLTDVSRKDKIQSAYQRLAHLGVKILGAVVTGAHDGAYGGNYYPGAVYGVPLQSDSTSTGGEAAS